MRVVTDPVAPVFGDERSIVTIGSYDGVHLGHQVVIDHVRRVAASRGARSVVVTFDRHPASVVRPESAPKLLTDADQRLELLTATGLDATIVVTFDSRQSLEEPEVFVERVLVNALAAEVVVVGSDFHFGHDRRGNVDLLTDVGERNGFVVEPVDLLARPDAVEEPVSSTAIRRALAGGDVDVAERMLGRQFEARGVVVEGDRRGRTIGFPTANVEVPSAMCLPADGVYAGSYERPAGETRPCAINVGRRPTFYEHAEHSLLEAHLIEFDGDLSGERARVRFAHFLRSERKFDGIDALAEQLKRDVDNARMLLA
ncbi:bifunctional riboflavin kinase/FAD synthetase [soil metagenome]